MLGVALNDEEGVGDSGEVYEYALEGVADEVRVVEGVV